MLNLIVTTAGRAAIVNAQNTGTAPVTVTQIGVSPTAVVPAVGATTLPGELKRLATVAGVVVADDTIHLVVRDESADAYTLKSFALYLGDGTLFAIYGQAGSIIEKTTQSIALVQVDVKFADIAATSITFGNLEFVNPPATTTVRGVVELSTDAEAAARTDTERAVTPKNLDQFARLSGDTFTGTINGANEAMRACGAAPYTSFFNAPRTVRFGYMQSSGVGGSLIIVNEVGTSLGLYVGSASAALTNDGLFSAVNFRASGNVVWHAGNDGSGSGLDADLLDGYNHDDFAKVGGTTFLGTVFVRSAHAVAACAPAPFYSFFNSGVTTRFGYIQHTGAGGDLSITNEQNGSVVLGTNSRIARLRADGIFEVAGSGDEKLRLASANPFISGYNADQSARYGYVQFAPNVTVIGHDTSAISFVIAGQTKAAVYASGFQVTGSVLVNGNLGWHAGNDGSGSGLDADTLDGLDSSDLARITGSTFQGDFGRDGQFYLGKTTNPFLNFDVSDYLIFNRGANTYNFVLAGAVAATVAPTGLAVVGTIDCTGALKRAGYQVWDAGNDGAGSGLDADLLDGRDASSFANAAHSHTAADLPGTLWRSDNDGSGSGLDADLLDGHHGAEFVLAADLASMFTHSFNPNGYAIRPDGLIEQWVTLGADAAGSETSNSFVWPISFPNACLNAQVSTSIDIGTNNADALYQLVGFPGLSGGVVFRQRPSNNATDSRPTIAMVRAVGY